MCFPATIVTICVDTSGRNKTLDSLDGDQLQA